MKKNVFLKRLAVVCLSLVTVTGVCACGNSEAEEETPEEVVEENDEAEEEIEEEPLTEDDLEGLLEGVEDHYVLQDAKDVDYMHGVEYDTTVEMKDDGSEDSSEKSTETTEKETPKKTKVIHNVTVDNSKVDASTPGTYKVTYTVQVNRKAYDEYVAQKDVGTPFDSDDAGKETDESAETEKDTDSDTVDETEADSNNDAESKTNNEADTADETDDKEADADDAEYEDIDEEDLEDVIIEKDIEIVDKDEAEKLVEDGQEVWTDENKDYGEVLEEEKKASENTGNSDNANSTDSSKTEDSSDSNNEKKEEKSSSDNSGSSSSNKSSGSGSSGSSSGSSSSGSSSNSSSSSSSSKSCDHNWVATYHEATGHYESVKVQDAYDEKVANGYQYVCNRCGYATSSVKEIGSHCSKVCGGGYYAQDLYETVHHDAVYEQKWVQDSAAYTTYKCSKCGATK